jgi:glycosyltransferase involved in cell wall biosynthesis
MQPNLAELIASSQSWDVLVLPTKAEAFGIVDVEAGSLSLPVIATTKGGLGEVINNRRKNLSQRADTNDYK